MTKRFAALIAVLLLAVCPLKTAAALDARVSGDIDADGSVSAADAALALRAADGMISLDASGGARADVTGNMAVGRSDGAGILLMCVGRISDFAELTAGGADTLLQDRFLTKFSYQGVVRRKNDYRSGKVSVNVSRFTYAGAVCYLADVYVQHVESISTEFGNGRYRGGRETVPDMAARTGAILAVNGDQYSRLANGPLVRNGVWYRDSLEYGSDICVLYRSGVMETFAAGKADMEALHAADVYQSWVCGPRLLDDNGAPMKRFTCPADIEYRAARTAIGYYEPGHYCLLVVDGTLNPDSVGILLQDMSTLFSELGCKAAYNLYGGASSLMCAAASGDISTTYPDKRTVSDMLYICEPAAAE